jgi:uncharacterized protein with PIN domain
MIFPIRFTLTSELGQLAKHMRLVGLDTELEDTELKDLELEQTTEQTEPSERVLVTSQSLKKNPAKVHLLKSSGYGAQLRELLETFQLVQPVREGKGFFSLCLQCNHPLLPVHGHQILERIGKDMLLENTEFFFCSRCERVFPKGAYYHQMQKWVSDTLQAQ